MTEQEAHLLQLHSSSAASKFKLSPLLNLHNQGASLTLHRHTSKYVVKQLAYMHIDFAHFFSSLNCLNLILF